MDREGERQVGRQDWSMIGPRMVDGPGRSGYGQRTARMEMKRDMKDMRKENRRVWPWRPGIFTGASSRETEQRVLLHGKEGAKGSHRGGF